MNFSANSLVQGQKYAYRLGELLGEGDAGEVFEVENMSLGGWNILKRPRRSAFPNEFRRQAEQIHLEGRILTALAEKVTDQAGIAVPELIDQAKPGTEFSEEFFIVISRARGFDLSWLARAFRAGLNEEGLARFTENQQVFLNMLVKTEQFPERILLEALKAQLEVFSLIHASQISLNGSTAYGLIWNDVKADHVFWDAQQGNITLIDWGNARPLNQEGQSADRRYSREADLRQFLEEMGRFAEQNCPNLHRSLPWPAPTASTAQLQESISTLHLRINALLDEAHQEVIEARAEEKKLLQPSMDPEGAIRDLEAAHRRLISLGEMPDLPATLRLAEATVSNLASSGDMQGVRALSSWAMTLPDADRQQWKLLEQLALIAIQSPAEVGADLAAAVRAASARDWETTFWSLGASLASRPEPEGWNDLTGPIRNLATGRDVVSIRPLMVLRRAILTLQSQGQVWEDQLAHSLQDNTSDALDLTSRWNELNQAVSLLREATLNWIQPDPLPPYAAVSYEETPAILDILETWLPESALAFREALEPARTISLEVMAAWERREYITAGRLLHQLYPWDPDRRRLIQTEKLLRSVPDWLNRLRTGVLIRAGFIRQITDLEFDGRELRNRIGAAVWLDRLLDALKQMRQRVWPADLIDRQPGLLNDMPWLKEFQRGAHIHHLLYPQEEALPLPVIRQASEEPFGPETGLRFLEPADAWIPEARGSSARVYMCQYRADDLHEGALKIMRMDKTGYSLPLFREEVQVLERLAGVPGVNPLLECGFLWMGEVSLPGDNDLQGIRGLHGPALRLGPGQSSQFLMELDDRAHDGWTPYLIVRKQPREENLLLLCDASLNRGNLREVDELLRIGAQICEVLMAAHDHSIVYRDHKILHYYWSAASRELTVIDWNVARLIPDGPSPTDISMDLVQLGARGLHHILTGRTAPGALPLGPTRPEEIEQSAQSYKAQWTFDDRRLNEEVRAILEQLLSGAYTSPADLRDDLRRACLNLE